jgi:hypothetical protein
LRVTAASVGAVLGAFLLVSTPYFINIRLRTGQWGLTAQMDNTSITRQIKSVGGDRWDRDQPGGEKIRFLGDEKDESLLGLLKVAPGLLIKTMRNLKLYSLELIQRTGMFPLAFVLAALAGTALRRPRDDHRRLFPAAMVGVWIVQLIVLYSVVTPYMVDDRYMYPLTLPFLILAAAGMVRALDWMTELAGPVTEESGGGRNTLGARAASLVVTALAGYVIGFMLLHGFDLPHQLLGLAGAVVFPLAGLMIEKTVTGKTRDPFLTLPLPLLAIADFLLLPFLIHQQVIGFFLSQHRQYPTGVLVFPYVGLGLLFGLAMAPAMRAILAPKLDKPSPQKPLFTAFTIAALAAIAMLTLAYPGSIFHIPVFILLGACLAGGGLLILRPDRQPWTYTLPVLIVLMAITAFIAQLPDYLDLRARVSIIRNKFSTGHREAALEIKARKLIPPGKVFVSRKPFLAYYLDGKWYLDENKRESLPGDMSTALALIHSGKVDYLEADSFTLKSLRPQLTSLAFALSPLPGARVVYSRYFPSYTRIITVYDVRQEELPLPAGSTEEHLERAQRYYSQGDIPHAFWEVRAAIDLDPLNKDAWRLRLTILQLCFSLAGATKYPTMLYIPELLPLYVSAAQTYQQLAPNDPTAKAAYQEALNFYYQEKAEIEKLKKTQVEDKGTEE